MSVNGPTTTSSNRQQYDLSNTNTSARQSRLPFPTWRLARFAAKQSDATVNSFSGALAGVASGIVTCPLDVIKTKLQGQGAYRQRHASSVIGHISPSYRGLFGTASVIWTEDGIRGMYRGLGPMLLGYLPTWAVYMTVYGSAKEYYYTKIDNKTVAQAAASVTAGACSTVITNPIWVIKTRLMSQVGAAAAKESRTPWHYNSTFDAFRKMYKTEGVRSFYSGLGPAMIGLTHVAIQFPLYEYFKLHFTGLEMGGHSSTHKSSDTVGILGATFLSKVIASVVTYPHEVIRTRLQTQQRNYAKAVHDSMSDPEHGLPKSTIKPTHNVDVPHYRGLLSTCRTILQEEGWRAFYYGMGTNLIRAVPAAMTTMLTFETLKQAIQRLQADGNDLESPLIQ